MFFLPMLPIFFVPLLSGFSSGGSFPKPLAKEKEQQLLLRLRDGTDAEKESAKQTLILHNLRLVAHIAKKYNNAQRESEELISIGTIGLMKAVSSFDYTKGIRFATYASRCIENEILMHFRSQKKQADTIYMGEAIDTDKDGNQLTLMDIIDDGTNLVEQVDLSMQSRQLYQALETALTKREAEILIMRYGLYRRAPMTQREVAKKLDISRSYVSRLEKKAIAQLKEYLSTR